MDIIKKPHPTTSRAQQPIGKHSWWKYILSSVIGVMIIAGAVLFLHSDRSAQKIDHSKYQVVYLSGGQAYFGKLKSTTGDYFVIETPYTAQTVDSADNTKPSDNTTTLLKVSSQVYGPDDSIAIKSSQVLFWQNLRSDSKVSKAIDAKS